VWGDVLIINVGSPGGPSVLALNKRTGEVVWKAGDQWGPSCTSPLPAKLHGEDRILVLAGGDSDPPTGGLLVINPSDGNIDLRFPFRGKRYESVSASNPVVIGHSIFLSTSYGTGGVLLDMLTDGKHNVAWKTKDFGAHFATPIVHDGYLYGFDGSGKAKTALTCIDLKTGKRQWREQPIWDELVEKNGKKEPTTFGIFSGTMIRADGHYLCLGEMGHLLWLDLTPASYKELARTWLFAANESWTPPVISRGLLYITQNAKDFLKKTPPRLLCYDLRGK
jgi:outer membrane protein assembly factor BamB